MVKKCAMAILAVSAVSMFVPTVVVYAQINSATDITEEEYLAVKNGPDGGVDRQVKVVDIGKSNVAVGILHRDALEATSGPASGIVHSLVTEVYYILSGSGILVTGGDETNAAEFPADVTAVRELIGPSGRRTVTNGQTQTVSPGDIVVIPASVPHGFRHIQEQITYLSIRIDPDQMLPTGYAHPSLEE